MHVLEQDNVKRHARRAVITVRAPCSLTSVIRCRARYDTPREENTSVRCRLVHLLDAARACGVSGATLDRERPGTRDDGDGRRDE